MYGHAIRGSKCIKRMECTGYSRDGVSIATRTDQRRPMHIAKSCQSNCRRMSNGSCRMTNCKMCVRGKKYTQRERELGVYLIKTHSIHSHEQHHTDKSTGNKDIHSFRRFSFLFFRQYHFQSRRKQPMKESLQECHTGRQILEFMMIG